MREKFKLFIGGSASTGSSWLAFMLSQHSAVFTGPETNLFTLSDCIFKISEVNTQFDHFAFDMVMSSGWHVHQGVQFNHLNEKTQLDLSKNMSYGALIESLYSNQINDPKTKVIGEKTPSNAPNFHLLLPHYNEAIFVLTVRDPVDAILSMMNRGWSLIYACGLYLFNVSLGYDERYVHVIKYEDLLMAPQDEVGKILKRLGLDFEPNMISNMEKMPTIASWNMDKIKSSNERKHNSKSSHLLNQIGYVIDHLCFKEDFEYYGQKPAFSNIKSIMNRLEYEKLENRYSVAVSSMVKGKFYIEKMKRLLKKYPLRGSNFPFEIID